MSNQLITRYANARYMLVGTLILLLAVSFPLAAAAGASDVSFSGDDAYDPAAGGLFASESPSESTSLVQAGLAFRGGYSGDDAYDAAAGGLFASESPSESTSLVQAGLAFRGGYSGDDAYDPAARGLSASFSLAAEGDDCDDPSGLASVGSFSGDDAYDPAAGGIPNSSLMAMACLVPGIALQ
jgi:hypothetical protein